MPPPSRNRSRTKTEPLLPRPSRTESLMYVVSSHEASSSPSWSEGLITRTRSKTQPAESSRRPSCVKTSSESNLMMARVPGAGGCGQIIYVSS